MKIIKKKSPKNSASLIRIMDNHQQTIQKLYVGLSFEPDCPQVRESLLKARLHLIAADRELSQASRYQTAMRGGTWIVIQGGQEK